MKSILDKCIEHFGHKGGFTGSHGLRANETAILMSQGAPIPVAYGPMPKDSEEPSADCAISPEHLAAETIRAKVKELNAAIQAAAELNIRVELDTGAYFEITTGETSYLTATILKRI